MRLKKIWERYFFKEALKTALLFLGCFYGLYVLIDYAHHASHFRGSDGHFDWQLFCIYYVCDFIDKGELLLPLSILLGTIKVLCKLNEDNEIIALLAGGIKMNALLHPFLILGLLGTTLLYINNQLLLPMAAKELKYIEDRHSRIKQARSNQLAAQHLILDDHSTLLFQQYDSSRDLFIDVFWIRSSDHIYRIKELYLAAEAPIGLYVDRLNRDEKNNLIAEAYSPSMTFPEIKFSEMLLQDTLTQPETLSLTDLWAKLPGRLQAESEKQARLVTTFYQKIVSPWLCLLAVIAPAPFCLRFSRRFPVFLVYGCSIFGFLAIFIIFNAAHVLGRRQFIDPLMAIWLPCLCFTFLGTWSFISMRKGAKS